MKRTRILPPSIALILCLALAAPLFGADLGPEFMDVDELRPGMTGYGLTSFEPGKINRFEVKILGVRANRIAPGLDMIIIQCDHPLLTGGGIVSGMSGSPVYIDERLIGAVAYGWGSSRRPIGGVTPIAKMLEVLEETSLKDKGQRTTSAVGASSNGKKKVFRFDPETLAGGEASARPSVRLDPGSLPGATADWPVGVSASW